MHKLFIIFALLAFSACDSQLAVMGPQKQAEDGPPEVFALNRLKANSGDLVQVSGVNLTPGLFVQIAGKNVALKVSSSSTASFIMPMTDGSGSIGATFVGSKGEALGTIALVDNKNSATVPVMDVDPGAVCSDQTYQDPQGHIKMGLRNCAASFKICEQDGETSCVTSASYPAVSVSGLLAQKTKIRADTTIAGVKGALVDCAEDGAMSCVANPLYPALEKSLITGGVLKSGITISGVVGTYAPPCTHDGQTSCLTDSRYKSVDTSAYTPWDIRFGKTVGGISGSIQYFKNLSNLSVFNRSSGTASDASITSADFYDTLNDMSNNLPLQAPSGFPSAPGSNWVRDSLSDNGSGGGSASNSICDGSEDCVYVDRLTGSFWAKDDGLGTRNWETAINDCDSRVYGGYSDWRVPTQKELWQSVINGIISKKSILGINDTYWSSTTDSGTQGDAWTFWMQYGHTSGNNKTSSSNYVLCVR